MTKIQQPEEASITFTTLLHDYMSVNFYKLIRKLKLKINL